MKRFKVVLPSRLNFVFMAVICCIVFSCLLQISPLVFVKSVFAQGKSATDKEIEKLEKDVEYYQSQREKARVTQCVSNMKNISTALEMYKTDHKRYPDSLRKLAPNYLRVLPSCAAAGRDTYTSSYKILDGGKSYIFYCKGHYHQKAGLPADYPRYEESKGLFIKPGVQDPRDKQFRKKSQANDLLFKAFDCFFKKDYRRSRVYLNQALKNPNLDPQLKTQALVFDKKLKEKGY